MADIPLDKAEIIAIFLETFLYGIALTCFCFTLWVLLNKAADPKTRRIMLAIAITLFVLATVHLIIDFVRILQAFVFFRNSLGPLGYYNNVAHPLHIAKTGIYITQTLIGDALVTWRCWVVHRENHHVIIFPVLTSAGCAATGYFTTWNMTNATPGLSIFDAGGPWITSYFVLTMATNLYCTSMIVLRIWTASRSVPTHHQSTLRPVIFAVVESAGLYSSALLGLLIAYVTNSNGQYPAVDTLMPLIIIVFSLIILQINFGTSGTKTSTPNYSPAEASRIGFANSDHTYPLQGISVEISHAVDSGVPGVPSFITDQKQPTPEQMWSHA